MKQQILLVCALSLLASTQAPAQGLGRFLKKAAAAAVSTAEDVQAMSNTEDLYRGDGPIRLRPTLAKEMQCGWAAPMELGKHFAGEFTARDCVHSVNDEPVDVYRVTLSEQRDVVVQVQSTGLDVITEIRDAEGARLEGINRRDFGQLRMQLAPGTYYLRLAIDWHGGRKTGSYSVVTTTDREGFDGCLSVGTIQGGVPVQGALSVSDCLADERGDGWPADYYAFELPSERDVTIMLTAPGNFAELALFQADGVRIERTSGDQISTQLAPGRYIVRVSANGMGDKKTGGYTLKVK